jgi:hypothetical protein
MSPPGDIYLTAGTGAPRPAFSGRVARGWGGPATGEGRARAESRPAPRSHLEWDWQRTGACRDADPDLF